MPLLYGVVFYMDNLSKPRIEPTASTEPAAIGEREAKSADSLKEGDLYATYELDHSKPYLADYFGISDVWNEPDLSYKDEVGQIDNYLRGEISEKSLANTTDAVKSRIKQLEKLAGITPTQPASLRVQQLAAYADYLTKLSGIKLKVRFDG